MPSVTFLKRGFQGCLLCCVLLFSSGLWANGLLSEQEPAGYIARIELNTPEDLRNALQRAEMLFGSGALVEGEQPVTFVVHGPEVAVFFKDNYVQHSAVVDLAAKLTAFQVVDIRICETRTGVLGRSKTDLVPFVNTVPFGPAEEKRLVNDEQFVYF